MPVPFKLSGSNPSLSLHLAKSGLDATALREQVKTKLVRMNRCNPYSRHGWENQQSQNEILHGFFQYIE